MDIKWEAVPEGWALCFNSDCKLKDTCLRWQAAQSAPENMTVAHCVTPIAWKGKVCAHFASAERVRYARGFSTIYDNVKKSDYTPMRKKMTGMLSGKRYYYEYMRGERRLSPEQQEYICQLFVEWGYADCVKFDKYEEDFVFPKA